MSDQVSRLRTLPRSHRNNQLESPSLRLTMTRKPATSKSQPSRSMPFFCSPLAALAVEAALTRARMARYAKDTRNACKQGVSGMSKVGR